MKKCENMFDDIYVVSLCSNHVKSKHLDKTERCMYTCIKTVKGVLGHNQHANIKMPSVFARIFTQ